MFQRIFLDVCTCASVDSLSASRWERALAAAQLAPANSCHLWSIDLLSLPRSIHSASQAHKSNRKPHRSLQTFPWSLASSCQGSCQATCLEPAENQKTATSLLNQSWRCLHWIMPLFISWIVVAGYCFRQLRNLLVVYQNFIVNSTVIMVHCRSICFCFILFMSYCHSCYLTGIGLHSLLIQHFEKIVLEPCSESYFTFFFAFSLFCWLPYRFSL